MVGRGNQPQVFSLQIEFRDIYYLTLLYITFTLKILVLKDMGVLEFSVIAYLLYLYTCSGVRTLLTSTNSDYCNQLRQVRFFCFVPLLYPHLLITVLYLYCQVVQPLYTIISPFKNSFNLNFTSSCIFNTSRLSFFLYISLLYVLILQ